MNDLIGNFIIGTFYVVLIFLGILLYAVIFTKFIKSVNYFGYIMGSRKSVKNKMRSLQPFEMKNLINEISTIKFSSFITYVGLIIALLSFTVSQFGNMISKQDIIVIIIAASSFVIGSFITWSSYNDSVLYVKEYFYKHFDSETYELKK